MTCLEKEPSRRPESARSLAEQLAACDLDRPWTAADADEWWRMNLGGTQPGETSEAVKETDPALDQTMLYEQETKS